MLSDLLPLAIRHGARFALNAGGLNPLAAREALLAVRSKLGLKLNVGVVLGDAVIERLDDLQAAGASLAHMDTGVDIATVRERLLFANVYLGARPLVEALDAGADIVLTGRVADAALFLAPLVYELGWHWDDWDRLAQGIVVGHLLECSAQASGGNFGGDWRSSPDLAHVGYPIAEVWENGDAVISKAPGTGGRVSFDTLREQLLYEVHDPAHYLTPDVDADMTTLHMEEIGSDKVRVTGASGYPAPATLKIVAGYEDGFMGQAVIGYAWPDALAKAQLASQIITQQMAESGLKASVSFLERGNDFMAVTSIFRPELFDGQVFLITGGGTGIGRAIARELSSLGARVAICSRSMAHLEDTCASIKATGRQVLAQACDIRNEKQVNAQVQAVLERFGRLDGLVNNAGGQFFSPAENITPRGWQAVIETNLTGTFYMSHAAMRHWMSKHGGVILSVVFDMWRGFPHLAHSTAARACVGKLTQSLALEWAQYGIRLNTVAPGLVASSGLSTYPDEVREGLQASMQTHPARRMATSLSVAAAYISGSTLRLDGAGSLYRPLNFDIPDHQPWPAFEADYCVFVL